MNSIFRTRAATLTLLIHLLVIVGLAVCVAFSPASARPLKRSGRAYGAAIRAAYVKSAGAPPAPSSAPSPPAPGADKRPASAPPPRPTDILWSWRA